MTNPSSPAKKRSRGQPKLAGTGAEKRMVTLDAATIAAAKQLGGGNLSAGLREAVSIAARCSDLLKE